MWTRALDAALLRREVFRQVGEDPGAVVHAFGIVVLVAMSNGLGLAGVMVLDVQESVDLGNLTDRLINTWIIVMATSVGWVLWAVGSYLLSSRFLKGGGQFRHILRALGVSYSPGILLVLSPVPVVGGYIRIAVVLWVLVVSVVALHTIQKIDWIGTVLATLGGWFLFFVFMPLWFTTPPSS